MKSFRRKRLLAATAAMGLAGVLAACGSKSPEEMKYITDFNTEDYVILGDYKGVEIEVAETEITDEYVDGYISYMMMNNVEYVPVSDRSVESGDKANIDFEGKIDGEAFAGGTAQGYDLVIGSGGFIEGFEDGVIGMEIGETKDLELTFPDPYLNNPDLSGVPVVFTVTVNGIGEPLVPDLTDEYVAGLGITDCATVEEYREFVRDGLTEQAAAYFEEDKINAAVEAAETNSVLQEPPVGMVNRIRDTLLESATAYAQVYQIEVGAYVSAVYGGEAEDYEQVLLDQSTRMAQRYIMLAAVAEKEKIKVTEEELNEGGSGDGFDKEAYREYLIAQKASEFLGENAVVSSPEE